MIRRGLEACERLSPRCLYVLGRLAATLPSLYKTAYDVAKPIERDQISSLMFFFYYFNYFKIELLLKGFVFYLDPKRMQRQ